jgi:hypothetical protein
MRMRNFVNLFCSMLLLVGLALPTYAQNRTTFGGQVRAFDFAYGIAAGIAPLQLATGNTTTGTTSVTVVLPCVTAGDGTTVCPLATNAPITVGTGTNADTFTPSALSGCALQTALYGACTITGTINHTHGQGELVTSGTFGLQEAVNFAEVTPTAGNSFGGIVLVDRQWAAAGGVNSNITGLNGFSNVIIEDTRVGDTLWSLQPSTLTNLAVPTTLTGTTATFAGTGTWNNTYFQCVTYVDALGGEGPCSATFSQASGSNTIATYLSPAASTGAVGWRAYGGLAYNTAYLLPISATNCTLTLLEQVFPACAIGSNATFATAPTTTLNLRPNSSASPVVNLATPMPQGHTTFAYSPASGNPQVFQTNYGPFPQLGALTSGQIAYIGSVNLPTGFLNTIGRTVRLSGKIVLGTTNTATLPTLAAVLSWVGGDTAGVGITTCSFTTAATGSTVAYNGEFVCTLTTNAVGATAVGSIMTGGNVTYQVQTGAAAGLGPNVDLNNAAVGSLGLFAQNTINLVYTSTTNATATEQLMDLHVEVLQ